jgi:hypothetical protein
MTIQDQIPREHEQLTPYKQHSMVGFDFKRKFASQPFESDDGPYQISFPSNSTAFVARQVERSSALSQ